MAGENLGGWHMTAYLSIVDGMRQFLAAIARRLLFQRAQTSFSYSDGQKTACMHATALGGRHSGAIDFMEKTMVGVVDR